MTDALKQRGSLSIWFDPEISWHAAPTGKRRRQPEFSDVAIQFCLAVMVLFGMPLRQTTGFVGSLLRLVGLDCKVPDFSTLCRCQKTLTVAIPYRGGTGQLHLLIDATGIKVEGEGEWNARKHGGSKKRLWRKLHLGTDKETLEIRAVGVPTSNVVPSRQHPTDAPAGQWTPLCCPICWNKSHRTKRSPPSLLMGPMTCVDAIMWSPLEEPLPSSLRARMRNFGSRPRRVLSRETKL
jgi:hypothetical protein